MPVKVRPRRSGESGKPFKLVNAETGKVEAESDTREKADAAARARNAAISRGAGKSGAYRTRKSAGLIVSLLKGRIRTSSDAGHVHEVDLLPEPGTYVTRAALTPGAPKKHIHVVVVRAGLKPGAKIVTSPGVDGHTHTVVMTGLSKAADISGENPAKVTGSDSLRRESLEGGKKKRKGKGAKRREGVELLRSVLRDGLQLFSKATKREAGKDFPPGDFAYVPDASKPSTWKLRLTESPGAGPTRAQVGRAVAALGAGFRGQKVQIPASDRAGVKAKVAAAFRKVNPGRPLPPVLA